MPLLTLSNVGKQLGTNILLKDVSFSIEAGELCGLIGERGAGKRRLLRILCGCEKSDSGSILLDEKDITSLSAEKRRALGIVSPFSRNERMSKFKSLFKGEPSVGSCLATAAPKHWKRSESNHHILHTLESLGLPPSVKDQRFSELSSSQRQRAELGMLILDPVSVKLVILDEPFKALDSFTRSDYMDLLKGLVEHFGLTILLSDRSGHARTVCQRLIHLKDGVVVKVDSELSSVRPLNSSVTGRDPDSIVFLSYSRHDQVIASQIVENFQENGISTWFDQRSIPVASHWDHEIQQALDRSKCLVLIMSPHSVKSKNVMDEVSYALDRSIPVFPLLIEDCEVPFRLRRIQHKDFRSDFPTRLAELIETLRENFAPG